MKFTYKVNSYRFIILLGFLFLSVFFPLKSFALSNDSEQHFTPANPPTSNWSHWVVTSGGNGYTLHPSSAAPTDSPPDPSAQYASLYSGLPTNTGVTVTYTDPAPANPQNILKIDLNTTSLNQSIEIIATDGTNTVTALAGSNDIIQTCQSSAPVSQNATDTNTWETAFIDVSSLGAITSVQFIFTDSNGGQIGQFTGPIYLDNLRGDPLVSCYTPTNTPITTPTNTSTSTPTYSPTMTTTNTATETATNTPLVNTATNTSTQTVTNTATNTATQTATNTFANSATFTNTATNTATSTVTTTPAITNTFTPGPCQIEVYPNPMDFTASHNETNVPGVACPSGKCIVFSCLPLNATMKIYTVSLSLVKTFPAGSVVQGFNLPSGVGLVAWDGTNGNNAPVASGLYFYVVNGPNGNTFGKFAISKSMYGP